MNNNVGPDPKSVRFPCIRAEQPVGDIYVAVMDSQMLGDITFFDVRRVLQEERDFERYLGIQRPLDPKRVDALMRYVNLFDATFPTSIIIALDQDYVQYDEQKKEMLISNCRNGESIPSIAFGSIARVLDGQHRIAGLRGFSKNSLFQLSVTIFVGADLADQAHIFATVNLEQTKVNKSLVYDLYELSKARSPQKTCHNIVVALDQDRKSPLYHRVKRLGLATSGRLFQPVTQATLVEGMLQYISSDPRADRDILLRGKTLPAPDPGERQKRPLRGLFVEGRDLDIAEIFYNYFGAVRRKWPKAWDYEGRGGVLNRTNGIRALLRFFGDAYKRCDSSDVVVKEGQFYDCAFRNIDLIDDQITVDEFPPGSSGEARLLNVFRGRESMRRLL